MLMVTPLTLAAELKADFSTLEFYHDAAGVLEPTIPPPPATASPPPIAE